MKINPLSPIPYFNKYIELLFAKDALWDRFQMYVRETSNRKGDRFFEFYRDPACIKTWLQMTDNMGGGFPLSLFAAAAFLLLAYQDEGHDLDKELEELHTAQNSPKPYAGSISFQTGDIVDVKTDAVVNAANHNLAKGGGVCGSIFRAAGEDKLQAACEKIGHCHTGSAVITPAFDMKDNKYIIHAVGPHYKDGISGEAKKLNSCYHAALELAKENGCKSVGFPLISSGSFGFPEELAWRVALGSCEKFLKKNPDYPLEIVFVHRDENVVEDGRGLFRVRYDTF